MSGITPNAIALV